MPDGKKVTAPCGCPGEVIIGAYVRCLYGCFKDPYLNPPQYVPKRGEPGHVDFCACKPCTIRRRGRTVVLTTKSGKKFSTPWNGIDLNVSLVAPSQDIIRHWALLDEDDDVMVDGYCDVPCQAGDPIGVNIGLSMTPRMEIINHVTVHGKWIVECGELKKTPGKVEAEITNLGPLRQVVKIVSFASR